VNFLQYFPNKLASHEGLPTFDAKGAAVTRSFVCVGVQAPDALQKTACGGGGTNHQKASAIQGCAQGNLGRGWSSSLSFGERRFGGGFSQAQAPTGGPRLRGPCRAHGESGDLGETRARACPLDPSALGAGTVVAPLRGARPL
jgi:hypothetical protein